MRALIAIAILGGFTGLAVLPAEAGSGVASRGGFGHFAGTSHARLQIVSVQGRKAIIVNRVPRRLAQRGFSQSVRSLQSVRRRRLLRSRRRRGRCIALGHRRPAARRRIGAGARRCRCRSAALPRNDGGSPRPAGYGVPRGVSITSPGASHAARRPRQRKTRWTGPPEASAEGLPDVLCRLGTAWTSPS